MKNKLTNSQYENIINILLSIKENQGETNQHLKELNGTVAKHSTDISKLKSFVYKAIGGLTVGLVVLQGILTPVGI